MEYFKAAFKQYADFNGRTKRKDYWMFVLFYLLFNIAAKLLDWSLNVDFVSVIYSLILLLPCLSMSARRLHDTGRTGWWQLIMLIPIIGLLVLIYFYIQNSQGDNQYGYKP